MNHAKDLGRFPRHEPLEIDEKNELLEEAGECVFRWKPITHSSPNRGFRQLAKVVEGVKFNDGIRTARTGEGIRRFMPR